MEPLVAPFVAAGLVVVVVLIIASRRTTAKRKEALRQLAQTHGWQWSERDDALPGTCPPGPPFRGHPRKAKARNVIAGLHRGRQVTAFEYSYTTSTSSGQTTSATTHYYGVWTVALPASLPLISLTAEGPFGGRVARAFGLRKLELGDPEFDRRYKVRCDDADYCRRLLHPEMVRLLMAADVWAWRIDGNVMLSYRKGRLSAEHVVPRLDAMCDVLDYVPRELWDQYRQTS